MDAALKCTDTADGQGAACKAGDTVSVHYTGRFENGTKFDSSLDRRQPFSFKLGAGQVIQGWDHGVAGMKVGGKRTLVIPPHLAYGSRGAGGVIPPNATLTFEVAIMSNKITDEQVAKVARWAKSLAGGKVTLLFDADDAGDAAAKEALWLFAQRDLNVRLGWSQVMHGGEFKGRQPESLRHEDWGVIREFLTNATDSREHT